MAECSIMTKEEEKERLHNEVLDWIKDNSAQFKPNGKIVYDKENLERIKRFACAPIEYIDERIELNKEVSKNYHKFYTTIILAGFTAFYAVLLTDTILSLVNISEITNVVYVKAFLLIALLVGACLAPKFRLTFKLMKFIGLLRVIRDAEIEVYYLSKIKEYRESKKKPT